MNLANSNAAGAIPASCKSGLLSGLFSHGWHHYFAGALLFVFAMSHFAASRVDHPSQNSISVVFPFLTNRTLYLLAGSFEFLTAVICLKNRSRDSANLAIFGFLTVMVWYRWAFGFTGGGKSCGCIGVLGIALHLSQTQEKVIPIIVLVLLALMILPWLIRRLAAGARLCFRKVGASHTSAGLLLLLLCRPMSGQETIEVKGMYDTYDFNPRTGAPYTNQVVHAAFYCKFSGAEWSIYATNLAKEGNGFYTPWEGLFYDGTNTYTLFPNYELAGTNYPVRATITPGEHFIRDYDERLNFHVIWLTYGAHPLNIHTNEKGITEIPLPWLTARIHPGAFGFEWKIIPSPDERFVSECQVFRNTNLDLSIDEEMRRPGINPPFGLQLRNRFTELLDLRSRFKAPGFREAVYKCTQWCVTNAVYIPASAEFTLYAQRAFTNPLCVAYVKASEIAVHKGFESLVPPVLEKTFVVDYRYNRRNAVQILSNIEYVLQPGDSWRSDIDTALQRKADENFARVAAVGYSNAGGKYYLVWLLLVLGLGPVVIFFITRTKNKKSTNSGG